MSIVWSPDRGRRARATSLALSVAVVVAGSTTGGWQMPADQHGHAGMSMAPDVGLRADVHGPVAGASRAPSVVFDGAGRLWIAWAEGRFVFVSSSTDLGATFARAVRLNEAPEDLDANSESRPKIAAGPGGELYVSYTSLGQKPYTGDVRFSRSVDGGRTFSPPVTVNDDGLDTGHRFDTLAVAPDGTVFVAWLDKRDLEAAGARHEPYAGAALYYTISRDHGRTFSPNRKLKDHVCECCRIAAAFDHAGRLVLLWRDILDGGIRDHALAWLDRSGNHGPVTRATTDGWAIDACPHHGPSLAIAADGRYHVTWFTGAGPEGPGSFYAVLGATGRARSASMRLGPEDPQGHATVLVRGRSVFVAWKQPDRPGATAVFVRRSNDGGETWSAPREAASADGPTDHPFLVGSPSGVYLSWFSPTSGYRLVSVAPDADARPDGP